jgi:DNA-binding NarL/FixJ family response regulator
VIRVLAADDHRVVRTGLEQLLATADDIEVVGMAVDGAEAVTMAAALQPDVVLMDLSMPVEDGVAATRRIVAENPGMKVLVFSSFADRDRVLDAIDAGASGYLLKHAEPDELLAGIRAAASGASPLDATVARTMLDARRTTRPTKLLSDREQEVLVLVAKGMPNKQIARKLGIAERTVKAHLTHVFAQLSVRDRTQAAMWAREHGLV